jgi:hypothetical protein
LYLDADGDKEWGEGIYLEILETSYDQMSLGSVVLIKFYLSFVRDPVHFNACLNVILDIEGLEVSVK